MCLLLWYVSGATRMQIYIYLSHCLQLALQQGDLYRCFNYLCFVNFFSHLCDEQLFINTGWGPCRESFTMFTFKSQTADRCFHRVSLNADACEALSSARSLLDLNQAVSLMLVSTTNSLSCQIKVHCHYSTIRFNTTTFPFDCEHTSRTPH